ncbi:MAG: META domain-containing protein [Prevotellaceae bacterium]|jgi:heat shock protein HslJ|nr:META domain-containing protein [Prevotellaceae bacterium]
MRYLICIFCGFALFVACGGGKSEITSSEWKLVSVVSGNDLLTTENVKKQSTLKIEANGSVHGQGGCNTFLGVAVISGTTIQFDKIVVTQMACFDMKIETAFLDALKDSNSFVVESGNLKLKKDGKVIATFSAIE